MSSNWTHEFGYEDFRRLATQDGLSDIERIGFPLEYRRGYEGAILRDIRGKVPVLDARNKRILDIGPGCSALALQLIDDCVNNGHHLDLVDSPEMLARLPEYATVRKIGARFPDCSEYLVEAAGSLDAIICYSVLHYVFVDMPLFMFVDRALALLAPGGVMLVGDVPNVSMRKRFFSSQAGIEFHRAFMKTDADPEVCFNVIDTDKIDDAIVMSVVQRARSSGFDAYVVPQAHDLPMANRREDILIRRP